MADGYISQIKTPDNKTYLLKDSEKTDEKVKQTLNSTSAAYKLLFTTSASPTSGEAAATYYGANLTYNPNTKALVTGGTIDGLILTAVGTGFTIKGGTTAKTLTVSDSYTLAAACAKAVTDVTNSTARTIVNNGQNLMTERAIYYGLPTINGVHNYNSGTNYYIPTTAGTNGYVLKSQGSGAPDWAEEYKVEILDLTGVT